MYRSVFVSLALISMAACAEADEAARAASEYRAAPETTEQSTENLFLLGKVWGYLKYHHPRVTAGCFDWDEELLKVAEDVAVAENREDASNILVAWMSSIDDPRRECGPDVPGEVHFSADSSWMQDESLLGSALTDAIAAVRARPESGPAQYYVSLAEEVRNPKFETEEYYADVERLDWRYRLIALFRFWNIVEYWSPYRNLIAEDWDEVLKQSIPRFVSADDEDQYVLELMVLIARVQDGHSNLWSTIERRPPAGTRDVPVHIRPIEGLPVVWREAETGETDSDTDSPSYGLAFGDIVLAVDGTPVSELIGSWSPYYGVSNSAAMLREMYRHLLRGPGDSVNVRVERDGQELDLQLQRVPADRNSYRTHDRDGEALQMLSDDIAYLKLSAISRYSIPGFLEAIRECRGLIIDIRNYPSDFVVFALGQHFVEEVTPFARFTHGDLESPGTFHWTDPVELTPAEPFFDRRIIILVDESSQSQSEYTAMAFRAAPGALVIGSQTAGADGNISQIPLPGDHGTVITGIGVFYPDKSPTQQIGIVPDIAVEPTVAGVRAGRDEVLERAVMEIMKEEMAQDVLLEMTRIPHAPTQPRPPADSEM